MKKALKKKNVLFYSNESLFEKGISSLISSEEDVNLTVVKANETKSLFAASKEFSPDMIVIEQSLLQSQKRFLKEVLDNVNYACLISLDKNLNEIHVYSHYDISIKRASDLMDVILSYVNQSNPNELKGE